MYYYPPYPTMPPLIDRPQDVKLYQFDEMQQYRIRQSPPKQVEVKKQKPPKYNQIEDQDLRLMAYTFQEEIHFRKEIKSLAQRFHKMQPKIIEIFQQFTSDSFYKIEKFKFLEVVQLQDKSIRVCDVDLLFSYLNEWKLSQSITYSQFCYLLTKYADFEQARTEVGQLKIKYDKPPPEHMEYFMRILQMYLQMFSTIEYMRQRLNKSLCNLTQVFEFIDQDKDGYIRPFEIVQFLQPFGMFVDVSEAALVVNDIDDRGQINLLQFMNYFKPKSMAQRNPQRCLILILDNISVKILSSIYKLKDLFDLGVSHIEKLELVRKPYPKHDGFYFCDPSSLELILNDFSGDNMYRKVFLIFTQEIAENQLEIVAKSKILPRVVQFAVFNHFCFFMDENTFYYNDKNPDLKSVTKQMQNGLICTHFECVKVLAVDSMYAQAFAEEVPKQIQLWIHQNQIQIEGGLLNILVVERGCDLITPLLHDFSYQSLLLDLQIPDFKPQETEDSVYEKYRYLHIAQALEGLPAEFQEMVQTNPSAQVHKGDFQDLDYDKMQKIMQSMPNYNNMLKQYTFHMGLIDQIWKLFETKGLKDLSDLEQSLATGTTKDGQQTKSEKLYQEVQLMLQSKIISQQDKTRLILICLLCLQLPENEINRLTEKLPDPLIVNGLQRYGFEFGKISGKITKKVDQETRKLAKQKLSQMTLDLQRHTPLVEKYVTDILSDQWKFSIVKVFGNEPAPKQVVSLRQKVQEEIKMNIFIFMVGGISHAEIAAMRRIQHPKLDKLYIGSTNIVTPLEFLEQLK
ncbi:Syntaxin-binding protein 1 [Paramecium bursaria]